MQTATPLDGEQLETLRIDGQAISAPLGNSATGSAYLLHVDGSPAALQELLDRFARTGVALEHLEITPVTLEDVFIELTRD